MTPPLRRDDEAEFMAASVACADRGVLGVGKHAAHAVRLTSGDAAAGAFVENALLETLRNELPQSTNSSFVLTLKDDADAIVGGLSASTSYGWLLIKVLWVKDVYRGRGLGRQLVEAAERKAGDLHCHSAWLDTSHPEAMRFYTSLGYEVFGQLSNAGRQVPTDHKRWFMQKQLDGDVPDVKSG